jgi:hypothetical protein
MGGGKSLSTQKRATEVTLFIGQILGLRRPSDSANPIEFASPARTMRRRKYGTAPTKQFRKEASRGTIAWKPGDDKVIFSCSDEKMFDDARWRLRTRHFA